MMMRFVVIILVITAVFFAGCASSDTPAHSAQIQQTITTGTATIGTPTVTTVRQPITPVEVKTMASPVKIFSGDYHWVQYRENNTITLPPNPRYQWEYDTKLERSTGNYLDTPAIHYTITMTSDYPEWIDDNLIHTENGWITVTDRYLDASTNKFLGGTTTETIKGIPKPVTTLPANEQFSREDRPSWEMGITPFGEMNITLADSGTESVTVPAGTYPNARKYTGNFRDGTPITFLVVPGIPVPVQYQFPNKYIGGDDPFQSYELKGWG